MQTKTPQIRAYLSCALTGVDEDRKKVIEAFNVLLRDAAESRDIAIYLPQEASSPDHEDGLTPEEVYVLDRLRIAESDVVVADLDRPSFGVGQEIEMACAMGVPVVGYHLRGGTVSRMVLGQPGLYLDSGDTMPKPIEYLPAQAPGAKEAAKLMSQVIRRIRQAEAAVSRGSTDAPVQPSFGVILKAAREEAGHSKEKLSRLSGVSAAVIGMLEMTESDLDALVKKTRRPYLGPVDFDKFQATSRFVVQRLENALNIREADFSDLGSIDDFGVGQAPVTVAPPVPRSGMLTDLLQPSGDGGPNVTGPDHAGHVDLNSYEFEAALDELFLTEGATYEEVIGVSEAIGFEIVFNTRVGLNRGPTKEDAERAREALATIRARDHTDPPQNGESE